MHYYALRFRCPFCEKVRLDSTGWASSRGNREKARLVPSLYARVVFWGVSLFIFSLLYVCLIYSVKRTMR